MKKKKHAITLLEMMIVIFIIGIIGSVVGFSMRGSLNEGRSFKSEQGSKQVYDLLMLGLAEGTTMGEIIKRPESVIEMTGLASNPKKLVKDGWSKKFEIRRLGEDDIIVYSKAWHEYLINKKHMNEEELHQNYPWAFPNTEEGS